ncbi:MAG: nickel-dependent lactate racemase, partial [Candidatus Bathyarchaeia archaeon]
FNFGSGRLTFKLPGGWTVQEAAIKDAPTLSDKEIRASFRRPIQSKALSEMAGKKKNVAILVDDLTRPTPADKLVPLIIEELRRGGVSENDIRVIIAIGAHRPLTGLELEKKLGKGVLESVEVLNHNPYENLVHLGTSSRGTPIYVNRFVAEADLKIGVGCVVPHALSGFGGGGKIILPGVCGMETIDFNHQLEGALGKLESPNREDVDEVARKVGLDAIVNVVVNSGGGVAGVFVGDMNYAHREAVEFARKVYATRAFRDADMAILNAYPLDSDFFVALKVLWSDLGRVTTREGGALLATLACEQRVGYHALYHKGSRREKELKDSIAKKIERRKLIIFSPNLSPRELSQILPEDGNIEVYDNIDDAVKGTHLPEGATVVLFPTASLSILPQNGL